MKDLNHPRRNNEISALDLIRRRRSIRRYTSETVTAEAIRLLLEAAQAAPSALNRRPWEFVVVTDAVRRRALSAIHRWSFMCADAPVVFAVLADAGASVHWVEDTSAAAENLLLAAAGLELGAVWVAIYTQPEREELVRRLLEIPDRLRVLCLIPVGHPAESKEPRSQYDDRKVHRERYGQPWDEHPGNGRSSP